jgi:hypothetical protein
MERKNGLINLISGDDALQAIDIVRQMAVELLEFTKQHKEHRASRRYYSN